MSVLAVPTVPPQTIQLLELLNRIHPMSIEETWDGWKGLGGEVSGWRVKNWSRLDERVCFKVAGANYKTKTVPKLLFQSKYVTYLIVYTMYQKYGEIAPQTEVLFSFNKVVRPPPDRSVLTTQLKL